jgi:hypothetical protein
MKWILWLAGGAVVLLFLLGQSDPKRAADRSAIELCWSNYESKSLGEAEKRFIAGACEKMEADFRAKHNARP